MPKPRSPDKLTPKQEKFVQGLVSCLSQREAYKQAYNCNKMDDKKIDTKASELFGQGKIRGRYNELINKHAKKALWTRVQAINDLVWIKDKSKDDINKQGIRQANSNAFLNAIKELNEIEKIHLNPDEREKLLKIRALELENERKQEILNVMKNGDDKVETKVNQYLKELEEIMKDES